jgi:voltage-gated potassium channel
MKTFITYRRHFFYTLWKIKIVIFCLIAMLVVDAIAITYFEKISFADALYFTFITGLTVGYGDIVPVTLAGRMIAVLTGLQGLLMTGIIVAVAVYALKETMKQKEV